MRENDYHCNIIIIIQYIAFRHILPHLYYLMLLQSLIIDLITQLIISAYEERVSLYYILYIK